MEKDKRSEDFIDKVSRFNPSVLHLEVGMRVLIQDKHGRFIIPGEVIQLRSKRSCYVRNLDSGNLMLRNRRFLRKDPAHQTPYIQDDDDDDEEPVRRADRGIQRLNLLRRTHSTSSRRKTEPRSKSPRRRSRGWWQTESLRSARRRSTTVLRTGAETWKRSLTGCRRTTPQWPGRSRRLTKRSETPTEWSSSYRTGKTTPPWSTFHVRSRSARARQTERRRGTRSSKT